MDKLLEDILNRSWNSCDVRVDFMFGTSGHAKELSEFVRIEQPFMVLNLEELDDYLNAKDPIIYVDKEINETQPCDKKVSALSVVSESDFIDFLRKSKDLYNNERSYGVTLGIGSPKVRSRLVGLLEDLPVVFYNLFGSGVNCPRSERPKYVDPRGLVVAPNCTLTVGINLGEHVHLNTRCIVCHDVSIGDFSIVGPGAIICGNVTIGSRCYIGAGVTIKDGVSIADDVILGAGAVVVKDITKPGTYIGCPAKFLKIAPYKDWR